MITAMSEQDILAAIRFDAGGLVPAIAQQHDTGEVLMLAWMNRAAVLETLATSASATSAAAATRYGAKARRPARCSTSRNCASTVTATRCCCWSIRRASPAIPAAGIASSVPRAMASWLRLLRP